MPQKREIKQEPELKYPKPKILLVDMPEETAPILKNMGFNVHSGSLGSIYKVPSGTHYEPIMGDPSLPNYTEQEFVIVDFL